MSETIIWTLLPNGTVNKDGKVQQRVSAFLSFRLDDAGKTELSQYSKFMKNWTKELLKKTNKFRIKFNNGGQVKAELFEDYIVEDLWEKIFKDDTPVVPYNYDPNYNKRGIFSYPVKHLNTHILSTYEVSAYNHWDELPPTWELVPKVMEYSDYDLKGLDDIVQKLPLDDINENTLKTLLLRFQKEMRPDRRPTDQVKRKVASQKFIPFNQNPNPEEDFAQLMVYFEHKENKPYNPTIDVHEPDFHEMLSHLSEYPALMRALGLVLDFFVPVGNLPATGYLEMSNVAYNTDNVFPRTAYDMQPDFRVAEGASNLLSKGLLRINTNLYTLTQIDTEGSGLKFKRTMNQIAQTLLHGRSFRLNESLDYMRTGGVTIAQNGFAGYLHQKFISNNKLNSDLANPSQILLRAEDVFSGYRMDIYDEEKGQWFSLHYRNGQYKVNDLAITELPNTIDEGFSQAGVTEDTDNNSDLYAAESQFVWDGWSLSVPRPGKSINIDDSVPTDQEEAAKYETPNNAQFELNVRFFPVPGTLPRLRFGGKYRIRIRSVDLAGNSIPLNSTASDPDTVRKLEYKRFEPVASPFPVLGNYQKAGESVEVMVIRSNGKDATPQQFAPMENNPEGVPFKVVSTRYILPPEVDQMMAEKHGMFDKGIGNDKSVADIENQYDNVIIPHDHDLANPPKQEGQVFSSSNIRIDYLPDPMAIGITIWHGKPQKLIAQVPFYQGVNWPDPKPITIELTDSNSFKVDTSQIGNSKLIFGLPPGTMETIYIGSYMRGEQIELMGLWDLAKKQVPNPTKTPAMSAKVNNWKKFMVNLPSNDKPYNKVIVTTSQAVKQGPSLAVLKDHILKGGHWMFTPKRKYRLTHAIHQPYVAPVIDFIEINRSINDVGATLSHQIKVHGNSTEKMDIVARWEDPIDDIREDCWELQLKSQQVAERRIKYLDQEDSYKNPDQGRFVHKLGDTKARTVFYKAIGATRYREYFFNLVAQADNDQNFNFPITRESEEKKVIIKSSARPAAPQVDYIIQLNTWDNKDYQDQMAHTRMGGMFRVYLKRPWFSSGAGELLGVCVRPNSLIASQLQPANVMMVPSLEPFDPVYTRWAHDPINFPKNKLSSFPGINSFKLFVDKAEDLLIEDFPGKKIDVVGYPVQFDAGKQLWYADVHVELPEGEYFPFLRLNLCRFQPDSLAKNDKSPLGGTIANDLHLSKIVKAEFIQLFPKKECELKLNNKIEFKVRLKGAVLYEKLNGGNQEPVCLNMVDISVEKKVPFGDSSQFVLDPNLRIVRGYLDTELNAKGTGVFEEKMTLPESYKNETYRVVVKEWEMRRTDAEGFVISDVKRTLRIVFVDSFDVS